MVPASFDILHALQLTPRSLSASSPPALSCCCHCSAAWCYLRGRLLYLPPAASFFRDRLPDRSGLDPPPGRTWACPGTCLARLTLLTRTAPPKTPMMPGDRPFGSSAPGRPAVVGTPAEGGSPALVAARHGVLEAVIPLGERPIVSPVVVEASGVPFGVHVGFQSQRRLPQRRPSLCPAPRPRPL